MKFYRILRFVALICSYAALQAGANGQIVIAGNGTYTQDFNSMGTASGGSYPVGWTGIKLGGSNATVIGAAVNPTTGTGTSTTGAIYNFGSAGNPDRALGSLASSGFWGAIGASFMNNSGEPIAPENIQLAFRSELWRAGPNAAIVESLSFEWKIGGTMADLTGWSPVEVFAVTEAAGDGGTGAKDGNATGNFVVLPPTTFAEITGWDDGQVLNIRWKDKDDPQNDAGIALDDFQMIVTGLPPFLPPLYWDANGNVTGAGGSSPVGTWGGDDFWTTSTGGTGATGPWVDASDAIFSAGNDATSPYTINVIGSPAVDSLVFEDGVVTLAGGTVVFNDKTPLVEVNAAEATIASVLDGSSGLLKKGTGRLNLSGSNTFTGQIQVLAGSLRIEADANLGASSNEVLLNGRLETVGPITFGGGRSFSGAATIAPTPGTELKFQGQLGFTSLTIADSGSVRFESSTNSVGALTLDAQTSMSGSSLVLTGITVNHVGGTSIINNGLSMGAAVRTVTVSDPGAVLELKTGVSIPGPGTNRLIKVGAGTLKLAGLNLGLNKVALGNYGVGGAPIDGGRLIITNPNSLGSTQMFFNVGTLEAISSLIAGSAIPIGISFGGRDASAAVFTGSDMDFNGDCTLFAATGTSGEIVAEVDNHLTLNGRLSGSTSALVSGFTVRGTGRLTLNGLMDTFLTSLRIADTVTVDLISPVLGSATVVPAVTVAPVLELAANTRLNIGRVGNTTQVTAFMGLSGAADSLIHFDIGGVNRGADIDGYDALVLDKMNNGTADIAGNVAFHGAIKVDFINGFAPELGMVFDLLDWDPQSGTPDFSGLDWSQLPDMTSEGFVWDTNDFSVDGTIRIVSINLQIAVTHPVLRAVDLGSRVEFHVNATGGGPITYQWRKDTVNLPGEEAASLILASATEADEGNYDVVVSRPGETLTSEASTLQVNDPVSNLVLTRTPAGTVYVGETVTFSVTADGTPPFNYQWRKNGIAITGQTGPSLVFTSASLSNAGDYDVLVSGAGAPVASSTLSLSLVDPAPIVTTHSLPQTLKVGEALTLSVSATGRPPFKYQWRRNGANISGATGDTFSLPTVASANAGDYLCIVTNLAAAVASPPMQVAVVDDRPQSLIMLEGSTATVRVIAGLKNLTFAWQKNGTPLPSDDRYSVSADGKTLVIKTLNTGDTATYSCEVTGPGATVSGGTTTLRVFNAKPILVRPVTLPLAVIGGTFIHQIQVDPASEVTPTSFAATGLPPGLKVDTKTGIISGKPTATKVGGYFIKLSAINSKGRDEETITLPVAALPPNTVGTYTGPIPRHPSLSANLGGRIDFKVAPSGAYSGKLILGAAAYAFKGVLEVDASGGLLPAGHVVIKRSGRPAPPPLDLAFTIDFSANRLNTSTLGDGISSMYFGGWRNVWSKTALASRFAGYHTFGIGLPDGSPLISDPAIPQGIGFGAFTISKLGLLAVAGKTSDGEPLACSTFVGPEGEILVFKTLYAATVRGSVIGALALHAQDNDDASDNTLDGTLDWLRPQNNAKTARLYAAGFGPIDVSAIGGYYVVPVLPSLFLGITAGTDNASVVFTEGGISSTDISPDILVGIGDKNKITLPISNPRRTTLAVSAAKGTFSGAFTLDDTNPRTITPISPLVVRRATRYQGLVFRSGATWVGAGYFLLPELPANLPLTTTTTSKIRSGLVELRY